jgi:Mg2+ and Co2+ transporter CorA
VTPRWLDLIDPSREELDSALPPGVDPDVVEELLAPARPGREPHAVIEAHGSYVFGVLVVMEPTTHETHAYQEVCFVATPERLTTVRRSSSPDVSYDVAALQTSADADVPVGVLVHRLVDDVADTYVGLLDVIYAEIDILEDQIDDLRPSEIRLRVADLRHMLLHRRRAVSGMRAVARRVLDGRIEVGEHALFPTEVERLFGDTYDTLVRVTEELDVARDLLAGVRDHLQSKIAENQNEVGKKLTVIASLVLVPSLVVGFYGQNFADEFDRGYWTVGTSMGLIVVSTLIQLAIFRWRRWI